MWNVYKLRKIFLISAIIVFIIGMAAGCANDNGASLKKTSKADQPTETSSGITALYTENAGASTVAPTEAPTEAASVQETAEPTQKPDYSGGIVSDEAMAAELYNFSESLLSPLNGTGHVIALQFYATAPFDGIGFHSPTWTSTENYFVDYYLYKWTESYYDTLDGKPVVTDYYEDWKDGICVEMRFDELPDGEYLLVAQYGSNEPLDNSGVWYIGEEYPGTRSYLDDEIFYDASICTTIFYTKTPQNIYGPLSDSGLE